MRSGHLEKLEDLAFSALTKHGLFNIELSGGMSDEQQKKALRFVEQKILEKYTPEFLQAVIDNNLNKVSKILDDYPELLSFYPNKDLVIESRLSWHKFYAENALIMSAKLNQKNMTELLQSYCDKCEQTDNLKKIKLEALAARKQYVKKGSIDIPAEYIVLAKSLVDVFKNENIAADAFYRGRELPYPPLSEHTELALSSLLNILVPKKPIKLDEHVDVELFLFAFNKVLQEIDFGSTFGNRCKLMSLLCLRVAGLIQRALVPETAEIFCDYLDQGFECDLKKIMIQEANPRKAEHIMKSGESFYPSSRESKSGLGYNMVCSIYGRSQDGWNWYVRADDIERGLIKHMLTK